MPPRPRTSRVALPLAALALLGIALLGAPAYADGGDHPSTQQLLSPAPGTDGESYDACIERATAAGNKASEFYRGHTDGLGPVWQWYTQDFTPHTTRP